MTELAGAASANPVVGPNKPGTIGIPYPGNSMRIVDIDEASLQKIGQWPWSRRKLADLVDQLGQQGAAVIGFDVVFAEADRSSPARASTARSFWSSTRSTATWSPISSPASGGAPPWIFRSPIATSSFPSAARR